MEGDIMFNMHGVHYKKLVIYSRKIKKGWINNSSVMDIKEIIPDLFSNEISNIIQKSKYKISETIILFDESIYSEKIAMLPVNSVYFSKSTYICDKNILDYTPTFIIKQLSELNYIFNNIFTTHGGETILKKNTNIIPENYGYQPVGFKMKDGRYNYTLYFTGRYYSENNFQHEISILRRLILYFKKTDRYDQIVYDIFNNTIEKHSIKYYV